MLCCYEIWWSTIVNEKLLASKICITWIFMCEFYIKSCLVNDCWKFWECFWSDTNDRAIYSLWKIYLLWMLFDSWFIKVLIDIFYVKVWYCDFIWYSFYVNKTTLWKCILQHWLIINKPYNTLDSLFHALLLLLIEKNFKIIENKVYHTFFTHYWRHFLLRIMFKHRCNQLFPKHLIMHIFKKNS